MALYSTGCLENENGCIKCISLIKPKILICYMPYFEALWYPHPPGAPLGRVFQCPNFVQQGVLGYPKYDGYTFESISKRRMAHSGVGLGNAHILTILTSQNLKILTFSHIKFDKISQFLISNIKIIHLTLIYFLQFSLNLQYIFAGSHHKNPILSYQDAERSEARKF